MGLAERKAVQAAKDTDYKAFEKKVADICGYPLKLEFDWSKIENHPECMMILENKKHNSYMFDRVVEMVTAICGDDMGKKAMKEGLKEIKMIPDVGDLEFSGGVFTIHNDLTGNGAYDADRMREELEKGL